ncbi:hypothetical protein EIP91_007266 [Steccherinum ochraceum]|uniref:Uncharacterized protein n=1 Tax=Steccherinum ochraceum TaxID=92696 RepID=A0A4R0R4C4_9APHY|nr:hypothetical protein EIP91_007266 [Steccherinum ochraceum]
MPAPESSSELSSLSSSPPRPTSPLSPPPPVPHVGKPTKYRFDCVLIPYKQPTRLAKKPQTETKRSTQGASSMASGSAPPRFDTKKELSSDESDSPDYATSLTAGIQASFDDESQSPTKGKNKAPLPTNSKKRRIVESDVDSDDPNSSPERVNEGELKSKAPSAVRSTRRTTATTTKTTRDTSDAPSVKASKAANRTGTVKGPGGRGPPGVRAGLSRNSASGPSTGNQDTQEEEYTKKSRSILSAPKPRLSNVMPSSDPKPKAPHASASSSKDPPRTIKKPRVSFQPDTRDAHGDASMQGRPASRTAGPATKPVKEARRAEPTPTPALAVPGPIAPIPPTPIATSTPPPLHPPAPPIVNAGSLPVVQVDLTAIASHLQASCVAVHEKTSARLDQVVASHQTLASATDSLQTMASDLEARLKSFEANSFQQTSSRLDQLATTMKTTQDNMNALRQEFTTLRGKWVDLDKSAVQLAHSVKTVDMESTSVNERLGRLGVRQSAHYVLYTHSSLMLIDLVTLAELEENLESQSKKSDDFQQQIGLKASVSSLSSVRDEMRQLSLRLGTNTSNSEADLKARVETLESNQRRLDEAIETLTKNSAVPQSMTSALAQIAATIESKIPTPSKATPEPLALITKADKEEIVQQVKEEVLDNIYHTVRTLTYGFVQEMYPRMFANQAGLRQEETENRKRAASTVEGMRARSDKSSGHDQRRHSSQHAQSSQDAMGRASSSSFQRTHSHSGRHSSMRPPDNDDMPHSHRSTSRPPPINVPTSPHSPYERSATPGKSTYRPTSPPSPSPRSPHALPDRPLSSDDREHRRHSRSRSRSRSPASTSTTHHNFSDHSPTKDAAPAAMAIDQDYPESRMREDVDDRTRDRHKVKPEWGAGADEDEKMGPPPVPFKIKGAHERSSSHRHSSSSRRSSEYRDSGSTSWTDIQVPISPADGTPQYSRRERTASSSSREDGSLKYPRSPRASYPFSPTKNRDDTRNRVMLGPQTEDRWQHDAFATLDDAGAGGGGGEKEKKEEKERGRRHHHHHHRSSEDGERSDRSRRDSRGRININHNVVGGNSRGGLDG